MTKLIDLKQIEIQALSLFKSGFNCSQSVLSSYSNYLGVDNDIALSVSCGFGAGMGRLQGTCGVVTAAYMIFGVYCSNRFDNNEDRKQKSYLMIQAFNTSFVEKHKTTDCGLLLNCDLNTKEGKEKFQSDNLIEKVCQNCLKDSIRFINDQIIGD